MTIGWLVHVLQAPVFIHCYQTPSLPNSILQASTWLWTFNTISSCLKKKLCSIWPLSTWDFWFYYNTKAFINKKLISQILLRNFALFYVHVWDKCTCFSHIWEYFEHFFGTKVCTSVGFRLRFKRIVLCVAWGVCRKSLVACMYHTILLSCIPACIWRGNLTTEPQGINASRW